MAALGLNAWLVVHLIPSLYVGAALGPTLLLAALPLGALAGGALCLGARRAAARWILLAAYPPCLAAAVGLRDELVTREAYDEATTLLAAASLLAYLAAAAHATSRAPSHEPVTVHPLVGEPPVVEPPARRWLRRVLLALAALGGFAVAVLGPAIGSRRARIDAWGEAADEGAVLTAVVAAVVAAAAVGAIVGPRLRAERRRPGDAARARRRSAAALVVAIAAGLAWLLLRHFDRALG